MDLTKIMAGGNGLNTMDDMSKDKRGNSIKGLHCENMQA